MGAKKEMDEYGQISYYKMRLVVRGFSQKESIDYHMVFIPTGKISSFRVFVAIARERGMIVHHMDVATAFLYGTCQEVIYMVQPEGYHDGTAKVQKLLKSLYGLKQAHRVWNTKVMRVLDKLGFKTIDADQCIFENDEPKKENYCPSCVVYTGTI